MSILIVNPENSIVSHTFEDKNLLTTGNRLVEYKLGPGSDPANGRLISIEGAVNSQLRAVGTIFNDGAAPLVFLRMKMDGDCTLRLRPREENVAGWSTYTSSIELGDSTWDHYPRSITGRPLYVSPGQSASFDYIYNRSGTLNVATNFYDDAEPYGPDEHFAVGFVTQLKHYLFPYNGGGPNTPIVNGQGARIEWDILSSTFSFDYQYVHSTTVAPPRVVTPEWPAGTIRIYNQLKDVLVQYPQFLDLINQWIANANAANPGLPPLLFL